MGKENNISEFDSLFKQSLEGASNPVPPGVWEGVSSVTSGAAGASSASLVSKLFGLKGAAIIGSVAVLVTTMVVLTQSGDNALTETVVESSQPKEISQLTTPTVEPKKNVVALNQEDSGSGEQTDKKEKKNPTNITQSEDESKVGGETPGNDSPQSGEIKSLIDNASAERKDQPDEPKLNLTMVATSETVCVGQQVDVSVVAPNTVKDLKWYVDAKSMTSDKKYMSFLFDETGNHVIEVTAVTPRGTTIKSTKRIEVIGADASFKVTQNGDEITLASLRPTKSNKWYVNNVLVRENLTATTIKTETELNHVVHIATSLNGCIDTARQSIERLPNCAGEFKIPNVFSPLYQDGINDEFVIDMPQVEGYRLTVYNLKDGKVVFDTENQDENWNGKYNNVGAMVPVGFYIYRLVYECNGKTTTKQDRVTVSDAKN